MAPRTGRGLSFSVVRCGAARGGNFHTMRRVPTPRSNFSRPRRDPPSVTLPSKCAAPISTRKGMLVTRRRWGAITTGGAGVPLSFRGRKTEIVGLLTPTFLFLVTRPAKKTGFRFWACLLPGFFPPARAAVSRRALWPGPHKRRVFPPSNPNLALCRRCKCLYPYLTTQHKKRAKGGPVVRMMVDETAEKTARDPV